jgi:pSer/pThr/pTyr-binding forkhead associated (FHA) protein
LSRYSKIDNKNQQILGDLLMSSADEYFVKVKKGPGKGKRYLVRLDALVIGASPDADIVLEGPGVDLRHAQIVFQGGKVILEDLGSQEGTFRNGQRLLAPLQVFPGDKIGLGPLVTIILEGRDPREPEETSEDSETSLGFTPGSTEEG